MVITLIVSFVLGNGITKPIINITFTADLISQGKMDLDILPEGRNDEIGMLTKAFNRLVTSLMIVISQ